MTGRTMASARIAIVGGGIGGLAAAAFLARAGLPSTVYEQAASVGEVGAGLVVAPNAARALRKIGAMEELSLRAVRLDIGWEFRRWEDGKVLSWEDLSSSCERLYGEQTYTAHRADLLRAIEGCVPQTAIELGHKCIGIDACHGGMRLEFADGQWTEADIVVGADGIHSVVRSALFGPASATYSGMCAFRSLVPAHRAPVLARRSAQTLWIGPDHHLVHYPVSAGEQVNLVGFAPAGSYTAESWSATATVEEFLAEFKGWDPRLTGLIRASGTPGRWALLDREPLERWSEGSTTLLGDAAHPMFPFFAQGAAQAIEDAAVLARCLADGISDPASALGRYEQIRRPRTTKLQMVSHARAQVNHLPDGPDQHRRDSAFGQQDPLLANGWIYGYDTDVAYDELRGASTG